MPSVLRGFGLALALGAAAVLPGRAALAAPVDSFVPFDAGTVVQGAVAPEVRVHFQVLLRLRDLAGLTGANMRHARLSRRQIDDYLPDPAGHDAVVQWLAAQGLRVEGTLRSRLAIRASGSAAAVARALGIGLMRIASEGTTYVSADREPAVPAALAPYVLGFSGLQPQLHAHSMAVMHSELPGVRPLATNGTTPYYPSNLLTAYHANGLGTGAGTVTAIVIDVLPYAADLTRFWATTGVSQTLSNITFIQVVPGTLAAPSGEESLDTEQASAIAPGSAVRVYATRDLSYAHIDQGFQQIIADMQAGVPITQVSISLGGCETGTSSAQKTADDQYFAAMTALGASVFVSSGDSGAKECGGSKLAPSFFATSPNVTAVGGTTLGLNADSTIRTETGWNGSGGGISKFFAAPSWQQGFGYARRAIPDVASDANPNTGVLVDYNNRTGQFGGTSVSAPDWAGLMALVNASRIAAGKPPLGLVASRTTKLAGTSNFRDVTGGSNGGYSAAIGYDLVTGVGTPVMSTLLATLVAQP